MSNSDLTADEMRDFLKEEFSGEELDDFDIEGSIYWFANDYHGGQWSNLYSALSTSEYNPGMGECRPEPESMCKICYEALEAEYAK